MANARQRVSLPPAFLFATDPGSVFAPCESVCMCDDGVVWYIICNLRAGVELGLVSDCFVGEVRSADGEDGGFFEVRATDLAWGAWLAGAAERYAAAEALATGGNPCEAAALESEAEGGPRRRLKRKTPSDPAPVAVASSAGACEKETGGARAAGVRRRRLTLKTTPSDPAVEIETGGKDKDRGSQAGIAVEAVAGVRPRRLRL